MSREFADPSTPGIARARNVWVWTSGSVLPVFAGLGWYYSSVLLHPDRAVRYPDRVHAARDGRLWLVRSRWTQQPGRWGLRWSGGRGTVGPVLAGAVAPVRPSDRLVCRAWLDGPPPPDGAEVMLDAGLYDPDPGVRGLAFREVAVRTPVGDCPAWFVPATGRPDESGTWVLAVHGRGADLRECLRVLPALHRVGLPVLAISYRNDVGAPPSPDGRYHLGDTEWLDLAAAVAHARAAGAERVVLYGWSMGATIIGAYLDRAPEAAAAVVGVVWDCPLLDWRATLRQQASLRRLPPGLLALATALVRRRIAIDFDRFDLPRRPPAVRPPTLLFHGGCDSAVPIGPTRALAAAAGRLDWPLRYVEVPGAEHTASWNVDPEGYERAVTEFLTEHALAPRVAPGGTMEP